MKKLNLIFILSTSSIFLAAQSNAQFLPNTLILKVKEQYRPYCNETSINVPSLTSLFQLLQVDKCVKKFHGQKPPEQKFNKYGYPMVDLSLIYEIHYTSAGSIDKAIKALASTGVFTYAEPHYIPQLLYTPNDPMNSSQYALTNIQAYNAWNIHKGDTNYVTGITDTGTELTHSDLQSNIKHNYNDPIDGIDNDGDGYIDNFQGWDVGMNDNDPTWQGNAHGVHVSGIAGGATDNGIGISSGSFKCKFVMIKIADASGNLIAAYDGIKYAAEHGCKVINCSWGGQGGGQYGQDIINYATYNYDALVVAACGNNGADQLFYPAAYNNVLAVASTDNTDTKSSFSNYGYYVGISAPGENILSTWNGNSYLVSSGTSMASPCVAGGATFIRSYFPAYNALQILQRLKQTADNIYAISGNVSYINKLGTGRLNLYRALTDPAAPAIDYSNISVTDHNNQLFNNGDTLRISGDFINYLAPTTNVTATLTCLSPTFQISPLTNTFSVGSLATMATVNHSLSPFTFKVNFNFASNTQVTFKVNISDGTHSWTKFFYVYMNADYLNITINDVFSTATSKGMIGYNQANQVQGIGFAYNNDNLLYEAGLMVGVSTTSVSNCVRNSSGGTDNEFKPNATIFQYMPSTFSNMDTYAKFSDSLSSSMMGLEIEQRTFAWTNIPHNKYIIWDYVIKNNSSATLNNFFAGIFADFDIDASTYSSNKAAYHSGTKMGYSYRTTNPPLYGGVKLLTNSAPPNFYAIDNISGGGGGVDLTSGYDKVKKYTTLSTSKLTAGQGVAGNDVCQVMSSGPYTIAPGQTIRVAFAIIAGDSLQDIINSAIDAQTMYNGLALAVQSINNKHELSFAVFPNPTNKNLHVKCMDFNLENLVQIFDISGKMVYQNVFSGELIIPIEQWNKGVYLVKIKNESTIYTTKIITE